MVIVPYLVTSKSTTTDCIYTSFLRQLPSPKSVVSRLFEWRTKSFKDLLYIVYPNEKLFHTCAYFIMFILSSNF